MAKFECVVVDKTGSKITVIKEARDRDDLVSSFVGSDVYLLSSSQIDDHKARKLGVHVRDEEIIVFTEIMSMLVNSGLSVQHALLLVGQISDKQALKQLSKTLLQSINSGCSLSKAISLYDKVFSPIYISLVTIGDKIGKINVILDMLAKYLLLIKSIKGKIRNALIYPVIVLFLAVLGSIGISVYVVPKMVEVLSVFESNAAGTMNSTGSTGLSALNVLVICFSVCLLGLTIRYMRMKSDTTGVYIDLVLLKCPGVGKLISQYETLNFAFAMEMLISSGFSVQESLCESKKCVRNMAYRRSLDSILKNLEQGKKLSDCFLASENIPGYLATWVAVAEETGTIHTVFSQIRNYYQEEMEDATGKIVTTVEPVAILVVGLIVLMLVVQFVLPVFSMYGRVL